MVQTLATSPAIRSIVGTNNGIGAQALVLAGTDDQKARWLPDLAAGRKLAAFVLTEPNVGSDAYNLETWAERQSARSGLELRVARMSIELHPPVGTDKGAVVTGLAAGLRHVCFFGDDVGDLPAFAALDELRAGGVSVAKVVVRSVELDPRLAAAADLTVAGPAEALGVLRALVDELS